MSSVALLQDEALQVVAHLGSLRQLRAVGCAALTDGALRHLAASPGLVQIDLGCNPHITDEGLIALAAITGAQTNHTPAAHLAFMLGFPTPYAPAIWCSKGFAARGREEDLRKGCSLQIDFAFRVSSIRVAQCKASCGGA